MNLLFPLLGLGLTAGGVFAGTLQQNFSEKRTEIDKFFDEIVEQIRKFSKKYPITEEQLEKIKNSQISLSEDEFRKKEMFLIITKKNQKILLMLEYIFEFSYLLIMLLCYEVMVKNIQLFLH